MDLNITLDPRTGLPKKPGQSPTVASPFAADTYSPGVAPSDLASTLFGSPSAPPAQGPGAGVPGMPDYASLIANDPLFKQSQADMAAMGIQDEATRNAAINRAVIQFGAAPDLLKAQQALGLDLGSILNPETADLAAQNQYSTQAQLARANSDGIRQLRKSLAARGGLQSGELGYQLQQHATRFGQAQSDATQKLLDFLGGIQSSFTNYQRQQAEAARQAALEAAQRQSILYQYQGAPGGGAADDQGGGGYDYTPSDTVYPGPGTNIGETGIPLSVSGFFSPPKKKQPNAYNDNPNKRG